MELRHEGIRIRLQRLLAALGQLQLQLAQKLLLPAACQLAHVAADGAARPAVKRQLRRDAGEFRSADRQQCVNLQLADPLRRTERIPTRRGYGPCRAFSW